ncbi:phosphatase PAP2 family protein [Muricauda sp. JGD-17]|uniref:Phosphatase PAP2 family protein n=1 Tax=Flagellimonas ochracea TaxID=2696472 RepID=A0A964TCY1_9FLAO|nr:phosphatase PAP2 family protein [Allomuricauda ochracea]NAY92593.1 phosphatase PAP2 family protein [Allomuricauda ochracea]
MKFLKNLPIFLVIILIMSPEVQAQKKDKLWNHFTYDVGTIFGGVGHAYSRPFHWKGKDWANFGYLASGTLLLFTVDDELNNWTNGFNQDVPDFVLDYGNEYGSPENNYMLTGGVYLFGLFTKNEKLRRTGVLLISSATAGGLLQQVSKRIVGRARPKSGENSDVYDPFNIDRVFNFDSFPSGHAMLSFSNAYAIAKQFKSPWIKAGLYTVGAIPGFARIMDDFHWVSDVAFSTVLSIFIVESIDKYLDRKYNEKYNADTKKVSWNLTFGPNTLGMALRF